MYREWNRPRTRLKITYSLSLAALVIAFLLLTHHAPRRWIELDIAIPAVLMLIGAGTVDTLAEQAAGREPLAPLIAIVGCDGSGKSTLSSDMRTVLAAERRAEVCYLGLGSGELGNRIKQWPLIGPALERKLSKKAGQTRSKDKVIPGLPTALVVFAFSLLRLHRFHRVLRLRRRGVTVITDRYPQIEVPGFYDGPGLSAARAGSPPGRLGGIDRERQSVRIKWQAIDRTLVIRLNIDADDRLSSRKPDHKLGLLAEKGACATPLLSLQWGAHRRSRCERAPYEDWSGAMALCKACAAVHRTKNADRRALRTAA